MNLHFPLKILELKSHLVSIWIIVCLYVCVFTFSTAHVTHVAISTTNASKLARQLAINSQMHDIWNVFVNAFPFYYSHSLLQLQLCEPHETLDIFRLYHKL